MHKALGLVLSALLLSVTAASAADPEPKTEDEKIIYAIGVAMSRNLAMFNLTEAELDLVKAGLMDGALNRKTKVELDAYAPKIHGLAQARSKVAAEAEKKKTEPFLEKAAKEPGAKKTASGLVYSEVKPGTGDQPKPTDRVKVHYQGTLTDGTVFDSSVQRGQPASFPLNGVVPCWTEGVQLMKVGGKSKLICPSSIAYGDEGRPPTIKPGATLVFEVELLEILAGTPSGHPGPGAQDPHKQ